METQTKMVSIAQYAKIRNTPVQTIYSWIARGQAEKNGFKVHQFGSIKLIEDIRETVTA